MPTPPPCDPLRPGDTVCVVTGDVVDSTQLSPEARRRLLAEFKNGSAAVAALLGPALPLPVDIYGGDSWQMVVAQPALALRAALLFRAHLRATVTPDSRDPVDTRMALGLGTIDLVPTARVSEGEGTAFQRSGRALAELGDRRMSFTAGGDASLEDWDVTLRLLDELVRVWTAKQARAMTGALRGWSQDEITALWSPKITQPSVANHLRAARAEAVAYTVERFEARLG